MLTIESAQPSDLDYLVALESSLFQEDAGQHDALVDLTWPLRDGRRDFERLLNDAASVVLVARNDDRVDGFLDGYATRSAPTRKPTTYGILRSLYVVAEHRREGIGRALTQQFMSWARQQDCTEVHVDSYAANEAAQRFYERNGFSVRSVSRSLLL